MTLRASFSLRPAILADAELIQAQRDAMFTDMGSDAARVQASSAPSLEWLRGALADGTYSGILIEKDGEVVAGAGVSWQMLPPSPRTVTPLRAYIQNVYVSPGQRGQGLARQMMDVLLAECRARGVEQVSLHASNAGRPVYERLGFMPTNEMRLALEPS